MKKRNQIKLITILGFLGAVFSLSGDLLLSWLIYPDASNYYVAMIASSKDLSYARLGLSAACGGIGIPLQYFGFKVIAERIGQGNHIKSKQYQKMINLCMTPTALFGGVVHVLCVALMVMIKLECAHGFDPLAAESLISSIPASALEFTLWAVVPVSVVCMLPYGLALMLLFWVCWKGYADAPRWTCLLNPMVFILILNLITEFAPNTALFNGLRMANKPVGLLASLLCFQFLVKPEMQQKSAVDE